MIDYNEKKNELYIGVNRKINLGNYETVDVTFGYTTNVSELVKDGMSKEDELRHVFMLWERNILEMVEELNEKIVESVKQNKGIPESGGLF